MPFAESWPNRNCTTAIRRIAIILVQTAIAQMQFAEFWSNRAQMQFAEILAESRTNAIFRMAIACAVANKLLVSATLLVSASQAAKQSNASQAWHALLRTAQGFMTAHSRARDLQPRHAPAITPPCHLK